LISKENIDYNLKLKCKKIIMHEIGRIIGFKREVSNILFLNLLYALVNLRWKYWIQLRRSCKIFHWKFEAIKNSKRIEVHRIRANSRSSKTCIRIDICKASCFKLLKSR
jgi:hypothetical protein